MKIPAKPQNENERLTALSSYQILDTDEELLFDNIVQIIALICEAPIALVSLIDKDRQWFKAHYGLVARETPRDFSFCAHAIHQNEIFIVEDAFKDLRFSDNPFVTGDPHVRFYAGAPLVTPQGYNIGTLCVIDHSPRKISDKQLKILNLFSNQIIQILEDRKNNHIILDELPNSMLILSKDRKVMLPNKQAEVLFGYKKSELLGKKFEFLIPERFRDNFKNQFSQYIKHPKIIPLTLGVTLFNNINKNRENSIKDLFALKNDGLEFPIEISFNPIEAKNNLLIIVSIIDITERKKVERKLELLNERHELAKKSASLGIWDWDIVNDKLVWDDQMYRLYGIEAKQFGGVYAAWENAVHPEDKLKVHQAINDALNNIKEYDCEFRLIWPDKTIHTIKANALVIRDKNGKAIRMTGINYDITQKKNLERIAADALRLAHLGFWQWNIENNNVIWSDEQFRIFGYEPHTVVPTFASFIDAVHLDDKKRVLAEIDRAISSEAIPFRSEFRIIQPDTTIRYVLCEGEVDRDANKKSISMNGTMIDITERKRIEHLKNEFVSTVSHELRTPLTSIRGSLGLISSEKFGVLPEKTSQLIKIALSSCDRLIHLVNDILDIEKIESGKMDFKLTRVDLLEIVRYSIAANAGFANQYNVELEFINPISKIVNVDEGRIIQVLSNLISNAIKFSPSGEKVSISMVENDKNIRVSIKDVGPGIPDEFKNKIFSKFSQADSSDKRRFGGTGLGLSICKGIIEKHGGTISFESRAGCGATFYFELPLI